MFWKSDINRVPPRTPKHQDGERFTVKSHRVFTLTVIVLSLATGTLQYFGNPIKCWAPPEFTRAMISYAESICYFKPTYFTKTIFPDSEKQTEFVNHYKLVPFVLAFFGVLYLVPEVVLNFSDRIALFNFSSLLEVARRSQTGSNESRKAATEQLLFDLQHRVNGKVTRQKGTDFRRWLDKTMPSLPFYIQLQHISSKLVFAMGAILPLIFLQNCLNLDFEFNGQILTKNSNISNQTLFPKEIYCSFVVTRMRYEQSYTIQCDMPANDMFEKVSLLVCFLAVVVCSISFSDVISCVVSSLFAPWDYHYVKRRMELFTNINSGYDEELLRDFVERYLKSDVIYLLQLIGQNSSEHVIGQILSKLWDGYVKTLFGTSPMCSSKDEKILLEFQDRFAGGNNM